MMIDYSAFAPVRVKKPYCLKPLTVRQHMLIQQLHAEYMEGKTDLQSEDHLVTYLNEQFGTHKSLRTFRRIWNLEASRPEPQVA